MHDEHDQATERVTSTKQTGVKRRHLMAGAAALMTGLFIREAAQAQPVAANTDGQALIIGAPNTSGGTTTLTSSGSYGLYVEDVARSGYAIYGKNVQVGGVGVAGLATQGIAIQGGVTVGGPYSSGPPTAIQGTTFASSPGTQGVQGIVGQESVGLSTTAIEGDNYGSGDGRIGVLGVVTSDHPNTQTSGLTGLNLNTGPQAYGVIGMADTTGAVGVKGQSLNGVGVVGQSSNYYGCIGVTGGASYGIYGLATAASSSAFAGGNSNPSGYAAVFGGNVTILLNPNNINPNAAFVVSGGSKNAAVPHPDGTHRLLYCMESPESWFEDFGQATLANGKAEVALDPDFAAVVDTSVMHVFFTEHDSHQALVLKAKGPKSFTVEADATVLALKGKKLSDANTSFTYRIVAKRKDILGPRLAKHTLPELKLEDPTKHEVFPFEKDRFNRSPPVPKQ